jgi:hypothetical protein
VSTQRVGSLGAGTLAEVDARGAVAAPDLSIDWLVGADDRWHVPAREPATRQRRTGPAPVVETVVRAPGGDVVNRTYGAAAPSGSVVVVEVENCSPVPLTVALLVRLERRGTVEFAGPLMRVDGKPALVMSRPPGAWTAGANAAAAVMAGAARSGPVDALAAPTDVALLFPVPHRTCVRVAIGDVSDAASASAPIAVRELPGPDAVARGWERQLERGLQARLPAPIADLVDTARADLLLAPRGKPEVVAALEDWGFDDEAAIGWAALGFAARRRARQRAKVADAWNALRSTDAGLDPARYLLALRDVLARERPGSVEILRGYPPEWLGQSVTVEGLPLRAGPLSFAVRWHGARPALLWDAPPGVELHAPALDPAWSSAERSGEMLLAAPPASLLPMGARERSGETVDAPGQFS